VDGGWRPRLQAEDTCPRHHTVHVHVQYLGRGRGEGVEPADIVQLCLDCPGLYCKVQYSVQYCTLYCTVLYFVVLSVLYGSIFLCTVLYCTVAGRFSKHLLMVAQNCIIE